MTHTISIPDHTAERLAQLQAITGHTLDEILDHALSDHMMQLEISALRHEIQLGLDDVVAGRFSDQTAEEIFAQARQQVAHERAQGS